MSRTCAIATLALVALWTVQVPLAQSIEEKLQRAREMEASMAAGTRDQLDTVLENKTRRTRSGTTTAEKKTITAASDDLLASPDAADSLFDSAAADLKNLKPRIKDVEPRRFEQRIFRGVDRTLFSSAQGGAGRQYVLGPGDEISVFMWGEKEREYRLTLNPEGKIFMEAAGLVPLAGYNLNEAQDRLRQRLAKAYSGIGRGTTHVEVSLTSAGPIRVFVLGEVKVPGGFVFTGNTSVLSAVYYAQGPTDLGSVRNMQLTRGGTKYPLDLYMYLIKGETLVPNVLKDGDILFSPRADVLVEVEGDVGRPAVFEIKKGEGIKELLQYAGGLNATAAHHKITLQRVFEDGRIDYMDLAKPQDYIDGKATQELKNGDRLLVERSVESSNNFVTISGPVKYPGTYEATGIKTLSNLIARAGGLKEEAFLGRMHLLRYNPDGSSSMRAVSFDTTRIDSIPMQPKDFVALYNRRDMYIPDSVEIAGAVFHPGKYEYRTGMTAKDLVMNAGGFLPNHERGKIMAFRGDLRERKVEQIILNVDEGLSTDKDSFRLKPNDFVQIPVDPNWYKKEIVTLNGLFQHPGKYALLYPGEKLSSVIGRAGGFKENAYIEGGRFVRVSGGVGRMGVDVKRAIAKPRGKSNIQMIGGDSIFIPERSTTVKVIGEVGFETSVLHKEGASMQYYIDKAGGFTRRSEKDRVMVQYANGETSRGGFFDRKPDAGSVIYVPMGPEPKSVDIFAGVNTILGTMGVAAALILSIQAIQGN